MSSTFVLLAALASSPSSAASKAEALTHQAIVEYNGGDFDEALADLKRAYAIRPAAGLLFDLGHCHRALHHWKEAADSFRAYLRERPKATNRAAVEDLIADMEQHERTQAAAAQAPPSAADPSAPPSPPPSPELLHGLDDPSPAPPPEPEPPSAPIPAPHAQKIAVLDVRPYGDASADLAQAVTSVVVFNVRKQARGATVVAADEIRGMLGLARAKRLNDCPGGACLLGIAENLRPNRVIFSSIDRVGDIYLLNLELIDLATAEVVASGTARFKKEGALPDAVARSVQALFPK
jgi:tetratricopeptide (TPR) repeat protein